MQDGAASGAAHRNAKAGVRAEKPLRAGGELLRPPAGWRHARRLADGREITVHIGTRQIGLLMDNDAIQPRLTVHDRTRLFFECPDMFSSDRSIRIHGAAVAKPDHHLKLSTPTVDKATDNLGTSRKNTYGSSNYYQGMKTVHSTDKSQSP
jgi:hypothetical protein